LSNNLVLLGQHFGFVGAYSVSCLVQALGFLLLLLEFLPVVLLGVRLLASLGGSRVRDRGVFIWHCERRGDGVGIEGAIVLQLLRCLVLLAFGYSGMLAFHFQFDLGERVGEILHLVG